MAKHYAISDLHGHLEVYEEVNKMLGPDDIVYFLGDAGDRGPHSWETIKAIYENPQWFYIKGNHEDMLVDAMIEYLSNKEIEDPFEQSFEAGRLLSYNGGLETLKTWIKDGCDREWIDRLNQLPTSKAFVNEQGHNMCLCHAGFTPGLQLDSILWDRTHFKDEWPNMVATKDLIIVHGHTPIPHNFVPEEDFEGGAHYYCDNHKINIDNGGFFSDKFCLLDLDTYDEHIFEV